MKKLSKILLALSLLWTSQLFASALSDAKDAGLIGEQSNGYIGFVTSVSADIKSLVKGINAKRKLRYKQIAASKKIALSEVTKIGGKQTIAKTKSGNYIMEAGKGWRKK